MRKLAKTVQSAERKYSIHRMFHERWPEKNERGKKVRELADLLSIHPQTLAGYRAAKTGDKISISLDQATIIAQFFQVTIEEVINSTN